MANLTINVKAKCTAWFYVVKYCFLMGVDVRRLLCDKVVYKIYINGKVDKAFTLSKILSL